MACFQQTLRTVSLSVYFLTQCVSCFCVYVKYLKVHVFMKDALQINCYYFNQ